jgi:alkylation response protein AidB-like acyl-CoA dehydrogenase
MKHAELANRYSPVLRTHDRFGHRVDEVEYHPSYHALMARAIGAGVHSIAWKRKTGGFSAHAVLFYLWNQLEQGSACPVTMTFASIPVLAHAPEIEKQWRPEGSRRCLRRAPAASLAQGRRHRRHGDDGEAGWVRTCAPSSQPPRPRATAVTVFPATSGSAPRR